MFEREGRGPGSNQESDIDLYRAAGRGSEEALAALYRRHGSLVYRFSLRMCQDAWAAEEVTQEVFLALLRQPDRFDPERAALPTWLCGIARRQVWKYLERNRRSPGVDVEIDLEENGFEVESTDDDPSVVLSRKEAVATVRQGLDELPPHMKEVIVLCEFEEMTYEDAAAVLNIPIGTVRSRLHRAKAGLAQLLRADAVSTLKENRQ
jgi:RNA polymerase sigma-70 factor (ECF subfamily)